MAEESKCRKCGEPRTHVNHGYETAENYHTFEPAPDPQEPPKEEKAYRCGCGFIHKRSERCGPI